MKKVIILGAFQETVELCELCGLEIVGIVDNGQDKSFSGYPILGSDEDRFVLAKHYQDALLVNGPDSSRVKKKLFDLYTILGFRFATVVSPKANISKTAIIGEGSIIQSGVNVSSNAKIGCFCKLNFNANIMHDVTVGDFTIIAPNVVVLGRSQIGNEVYIGANSTIEHDTVIENGIRIQSASYIVNNNE